MTVASLLVAQDCFDDLEEARARFAGRADIAEVDIGQSAEDLAAALDGRQADGLAVTLHPLRAEHLEVLAGRVRIIGRAGIGLDSIDLEAARAQGIAVVHQPEYATAEVATQALALLLATQRRVVAADQLARTGWGDVRRIGDIAALDEATVSVIGCGRIGWAVIDRLRPFVREIVVFDPYTDRYPPGVRTASDLDEALHGTDVVTLHVPLVQETRHLIAARELALLQPGAIVVNVSRGGLIDEHALAQALASGQVAGAGLDVLSEEPPPPDNPLLSAPNVTLSPHIAWYSTASARRLRDQTLGDMAAYLAGAPLQGRLAVDPPASAKV